MNHDSKINIAFYVIAVYTPFDNLRGCPCLSRNGQLMPVIGFRCRPVPKADWPLVLAGLACCYRTVGSCHGRGGGKPDPSKHLHQISIQAARPDQRSRIIKRSALGHERTAQGC